MKAYIFILFSVIFAGGFVSAAIIDIPGDYPTIQQGIDASYDGDTVLVSPGEYFENVYIYYKNNVLASHFLITQDTSYIDQTIINAGFSGIVLRLNNTNENTAVIGLTIKNGHIEGYGHGAGINCVNSSSPLISHNIIVGNQILNGQGLGGGGIACKYSHPIIEYNKIVDNTASLCRGGGIACYYSYPTIRNNIISGNTAEYGGGIEIEISEPVITNNLIYDNYAEF